MEGLATLIVVVAVFVANLPALREQWRTDRAGSIKTIWMFGVYCLCRARDRGPASARAKDRRARRRRQGAYPHRLHGRLDFYGGLTLMRVVPRYREPPAWLMHFGIADIVLLGATIACLAAYLWA